jgi:anti-anti-sigma factor
VTRVGDFEVTTSALPGGGTVLHVTGDLDMATAPAFEEALLDAGFGQRLVIDLSGCTFLDSSAVRVLVAAARDAQAAEGDLSIVTPDAGAQRVLQISGVDTMLIVHASLDDVL